MTAWLGREYAYLVIVGLIALVLVMLAQLRAMNAQTAGRLLATELTLAGIVTAALGRSAGSTTLVFVGVTAINAGLTLYVLYLPDKGLLQMVSRWRRKDSGGGR